MDVGGAADLQTDIMRFMAILSLCLVAIFALVQSIPLTPAQPVPPQTQHVPQQVPAEPSAVIEIIEPSALPKSPTPKPADKPPEKSVTLTRPKWVPKYLPKEPVVPPAEPALEIQATAPAVPITTPQSVPPIESEEEGFTLRFESDAVLARLVAASHVGLYAIESSRAQRMTVTESRISFWEASTPNTFHEMETSTVPGTVLEALTRTGTQANEVSWGVTLPGKLKSQLDTLMQEHRGGSLIIGASGEIRWEAS